jgi:hypothetical protein
MIVRTEMMSKNQKIRLARRHRLPPPLAEEVVVDKKRKRVDEIASSSSAAAGKAPVVAEDIEYYDMPAS